MAKRKKSKAPKAKSKSKTAAKPKAVKSVGFKPGKPLQAIWWFWIPVAFVAIQSWIEFSLPADTLAHLLSENGPHETLQALTIGVAFIVAMTILFSGKLKNNLFLHIWVGAAALSCLYVAGEEISWGQHIADWATPDFWQAINDQGETNLHNTSSWLDQKPRLLLLIGVLVGGIVVPALRCICPKALPARFDVIYPPCSLIFVAALAVGTYVLGKIDNALTDVSILHRGSEIEELFLFYFVLLYLIALRRRVV